MLYENRSIYVPVVLTHRMENQARFTLELIEVQTGSYALAKTISSRIGTTISPVVTPPRFWCRNKFRFISGSKRLGVIL